MLQTTGSVGSRRRMQIKICGFCGCQELAVSELHTVILFAATSVD